MTSVFSTQEVQLLEDNNFEDTKLTLDQLRKWAIFFIKYQWCHATSILSRTKPNAECYI